MSRISKSGPIIVQGLVEAPIVSGFASTPIEVVVGCVVVKYDWVVVVVESCSVVLVVACNVVIVVVAGCLVVVVVPIVERAEKT